MKKVYDRPNADIVIYDNLDSVLILSGVNNDATSAHDITNSVTAYVAKSGLRS
jgi:hypothetical protein